MRNGEMETNTSFPVIASYVTIRYMASPLKQSEHSLEENEHYPRLVYSRTMNDEQSEESISLNPLLRGVSYTVWYMTGCVIEDWLIAYGK